mmetsp:Transcript_34359/g.85646  ORF Transcript_34359/g.85646 Transcript_34359/m.85646 type:complete len:297 (+) Transcript_34359:97-987(+)
MHRPVCVYQVLELELMCARRAWVLHGDMDGGLHERVVVMKFGVAHLRFEREAVQRHRVAQRQREPRGVPARRGAHHPRKGGQVGRGVSPEGVPALVQEVERDEPRAQNRLFRVVLGVFDVALHPLEIACVRAVFDGLRGGAVQQDGRLALRVSGQRHARQDALGVGGVCVRARVEPIVRRARAHVPLEAGGGRPIHPEDGLVRVDLRTVLGLKQRGGGGDHGARAVAGTCRPARGRFQGHRQRAEQALHLLRALTPVDSPSIQGRRLAARSPRLALCGARRRLRGEARAVLGDGLK